jgi:SAM-dependent methyltransferase
MIRSGRATSTIRRTTSSNTSDLSVDTGLVKFAIRPCYHWVYGPILVTIPRYRLALMTTPDPTETHHLFQHDRVAAGYASARPYLHPEILAIARDAIQPGSRFRRALDVGCGTGLSSVALLDLAREVVGLDAAVDMLRHARRGDGIRYVASRAEAPPFRPGTFDLVVACGSIDWVDRSRFLPRAAELLESGGWLVPLDFGDTGRSPEVPDLARWYDEVFQRRYPRPRSSDPMVTEEEAARHGFGSPFYRDFGSVVPFTARQYAAFLMTESNVIAAVEYGHEAESRVRAWLESELLPLFGGASRPVAFGGYIQALRRY